MSEEIRFEPLFGPQELFNDTLSDVVCVSKNNETGEVFQYTSIVIALRDLVRYQGDSEFTVAMRRIIKTPVWTKADQQAGRLPEVGCYAVFMINDGIMPQGDIYNWENGDELEILKVFSGAVACVYNKSKKWAANISMTSIKPIETPEERAKREEDEFRDSIYADSPSFKTKEEIDAFNEGVRAAYRKLKMPEVQE